MLEGTLESFALPDIFQLLAFTKKTGTLRLRRGSGQGRVLFEDGQVVFAGSSSDRLALGRRLVGAGLLSTDGLRQALEQQRRVREAGEGTRIGRILVELGEIDEDTLETFVREQIQDAIFDLMRWPDGSFSFDERSGEDGAEPIKLTVSVENLIMEGSRRIEEWEQVRRKIPDVDAVVAMAPIAAVHDDAVNVSLQPDEWRLLTVVDGRRTVGELVDLFGQGEFHLCRILYGMIGAGLLVVQTPEEAAASPASDLLAQRQLLRELEEAAERQGAEPPAERGAPDAPQAASSPSPPPERSRPEPSPAPPPRPSPTPPPPPRAPQEPQRPVARPSTGEPRTERPEPGGTEVGPPRGRNRPSLTADPDVSSDLVRRLIDGVRGL